MATDPHQFQRRILLAVTGLTPQILPPQLIIDPGRGGVAACGKAGLRIVPSFGRDMNMSPREDH